MIKLLEKQSYLVILLVLGVVLIIISFFDIKDYSKLQIELRNNVVWFGAVLGSILSGFSLFFYAQDRLTLGWFKSASVRMKDGRLNAPCGHALINISFGKIEEEAKLAPSSMVVLPANEYFDDECISDTKSSLGAYVQSIFPNQSLEVQKLIQEELASVKSRKEDKEPGITQASYGIGSGVFLKKALHSNQPLMFVSVTTKRAGEGLRAEMSHIFAAVKKIQQVSADNRIDTVYIPVMGTGHGGLKKEVGLFSLLLAICDGISKPTGHHIKQYNVIVYRPDQNEKPSISINSSKRILKTAIGLFE
jgi:hypothetical protein